MISRESQKVPQSERKDENKILVYICFEIKGQVIMLMINSSICIWEWVRVSIKDKCKYKHKLNNN